MFGTTRKALLLCVLWIAALSTEVSAQSDSPARRRSGLYGDWSVKTDYEGRQFESILSFSRNAEGKRTASWISFWGVSELKDVAIEDGALSFVRERKNREGETVTSTFKGKIEDGKLTGAFSSDQGERKIEGARIPRTSRAVGTWNVKFKFGDQEIENDIVVKAGEKDALVVDWKSEGVTRKISEVKYERGKLSFKSNGKYEDREWEANFEGTIRGNSLTASVKAGEREIAIEGTRAGAPLIGTWDLDLASERGERKQRLRVNSDMTALYGSTPVKVSLVDGKVSFDLVLEFGDRKFEMKFTGKVEESSLSGEITTSRGTTKISGKKVVRQRRGRRASA